jgi:uncharacterized protein (DUF2384 family)
MRGGTQSFENPGLMEARLHAKVREVIAAFDREAARRDEMRGKLAGVDAEVLLAAIDSLGSAERAALWLTSPEVVLQGAIPLDAAATAEGKERVMRLLCRLEDGMFEGPRAPT